MSANQEKDQKHRNNPATRPEPPIHQVCGAVLTGGQSRRMGQDKALLTIGGESFLSHICGQMQAVFSEVILLCDPESYDFIALPKIPDRFANCGPLGGIHAALVHAGNRPVFVIPCDMPFIVPELIRYILRHDTDTLPAAHAKIAVGEKSQPLCGLYAPGCLPELEKALQQGKLRVRDFLSDIAVTEVPVTPELPFYKRNLLHNLNTPAEYESGMQQRQSPTKRASILTITNGESLVQTDELAGEEPLEIRVELASGLRHSISVTMRTPGRDFELAAGFLFSEGVLSDRRQIKKIEYGGVGEDEAQNSVNVILKADTPFDPDKFSRNVYTNSSCGICGKTSIEQVRAVCSRTPQGDYRLDRDFVFSFSEKLKGEQTLFARTGGLHAAALFDVSGNLLQLFEDVGRHNALDKLAGSLLLEGLLPANDRILLVSGRTSYELVQKALLAGVATLISVGAPSSLAVELAGEFGMTLIGFLRGDRFNVYAGRERVLG